MLNSCKNILSSTYFKEDERSYTTYTLNSRMWHDLPTSWPAPRGVILSRSDSSVGMVAAMSAPLAILGPNRDGIIMHNLRLEFIFRCESARTKTTYYKCCKNITFVWIFVQEMFWVDAGRCTWRLRKQGYIFLSKLKNREEFEGGLQEKRKGKGGKRRKKERVIEHTLKYLYEA